jgi:hypothetical protein
MTTAWPGTLPTRPLRDGFGAQRQDNKQVFQPEVGDAIVRKRYTAGLRDFTASFDLSATQRAALDTLHDTTLGEGALPFTWTDPLTGDSATFRFLKPPKYASLGGGYWRADCQMRRIA